MAIVDDTRSDKPKGPSMIVQAGALVALTLAALGIGWGSGLYLSSQNEPASAAGAAGQGEEGEDGVEPMLAEHDAALNAIRLDPMTTNLAGPTETWVRLEMSLIFEGEIDPLVANAVQEDTVAYLRTVKVHQVEGASGFQHLKSDIEERARLRSEGKVTGVLIRTILFE